MKRLVGFSLFWIGVGILIGMLIDHIAFGIFVISICFFCFVICFCRCD